MAAMSVACAVEPMEPRRLLAGPQVVALTMLGSEQEVTGIVLTFSAPLDPASAQNPKAYLIGQTKVTGEHGFDPLGLSDRPREKVRVQLQSAVYDPAAQTVTLTPAAPFNLFDKFRRIRISGRGETAVRDAAGVPIDGDNNGTPGGSLLVRARLVRSSAVTFREADGDRVKLRLEGPGRLWAVVSRTRGFAPVVFLNRTNALRSSLDGSVVRHRRTGDGVATVRQISGTTFAAVPLLVDPAFRVEIANP